ncbi:hypothetical protein ACFQ22_13010 [Lentilactobacillus raoultii]|uniref:Uncharacterized protein n=1 Tax=Lentilactobacillus raoultii TaxID=1987503 RepID=A0ABW3PVW3_9LACO|nr:hypothetical protein [Lentilactobacillus raoultii]
MLNLKRILLLLAGISSIILIAAISLMVINGNFWASTPWISHNQPHGMMGWLLVLTFILWIAFFVAPKNTRKSD